MLDPVADPPVVPLGLVIRARELFLTPEKREYRNQEPMRRFIAGAFKRASLFRVLREQGYQVDAVSGLIYDRPSATTYYKLPTPYVTHDAYVRFAAWQLADPALFRHSPHVLKPWIYNDQAWRL